VSDHVIIGIAVITLIPAGLWLKFIIPRILKRNKMIRSYGSWVQWILGTGDDNDKPEK
jgi:hypothetical protein